MRSRGFTLVELAIALVIIGIILGGVLKGQELIFNAKVKRLQSQAKEMMAALYTYYDKYGYFPGDDPTASRRWSVASGNGNGYIEGGWCDNPNEESCLIWQHLRFANIISGDPNDTNVTSMTPKHAWGGSIHLFTGRHIVGGENRTGMWLAFRNLPGEAAAALDRLMDDGNCNSGSVAAYPGTNCNGAAYRPDLYYDVWINF